MDEPRRLHALSVGALYSPTRTRWPEAVEYNYRAGHHELRMFWARPSARDIAAVSRGQLSFALHADRDVLLLLYRVEGAADWSDAAYSWWLVPADERHVPPPLQLAEPHALLTIVLVDAETGIVRALRVVTFTPAFTVALHAAIQTQAARPWPGDAAYAAQIQAIYARATSAQLVARATAMMTVPGREPWGRP